MRKKILTTSSAVNSSEQKNWLDLAKCATVELTSEDPSYPIENALRFGHAGQWRASTSGRQFIRLCFDEPVTVRRLCLQFTERDCSRTQEFVILASLAGSPQAIEVVRQQWNFSPTGSTEEIEDYKVDLSGVRMLELQLTPSLSGGSSVATIDAFRVA